MSRLVWRRVGCVVRRKRNPFVTPADVRYVANKDEEREQEHDQYPDQVKLADEAQDSQVEYPLLCPVSSILLLRATLIHQPYSQPGCQ